MSEVKTDKLSPVTSTTTTFGDSGDKLLFTTGTNLDMNGVELILDADADTSITADTDDQIDIRIAGADDFQFTANKFLVQTGSTIDMNAGELILDADADTSITADTDDQIDFKVGGSDVVTIDSSGEVGIGTTSPQRHLHINNSGSATTKIQITNAATGAATDGDGFQLGISNDGTAGIEQRENLDLTFSTNNTERMRIAAAGDVSLKGDLIFGTAGKGVVLGVTTNTDSNTLDDYEEGTFTAVFRVGGASGTDNGSATSYYVKIGITVWIRIVISIDNTISGTGSLFITGLPFTSEASNSSAVAFNVNDKIDTTDVGCTIQAAGTQIGFRALPATAGDQAAYATHSILGNGTGKAFYVNGTYSVGS